MRYIVLCLVLSGNAYAMESTDNLREVRIAVTDDKDVPNISNSLLARICFRGSCIAASSLFCFCLQKIPGEICTANLATLQTHCLPIKSYMLPISYLVFAGAIGKFICCGDLNNRKTKRE